MVNTEKPSGEQYPENVTVNQFPEFNSIGKEIFQLLEKTGVSILQAIALHLKIDENYFDDYANYGNSILRAIHYPPIKEEPKNAVRAAAHGDINLITLLMGAEGKGLQVLTKDNEWIDAIAEEGELIINIGDMMERLTNNRLKSTLHRVVNPPRKLWSTSRYSVPFFMHPSSDMPLNCLEICVDNDNPKAYEDCTAGEFLEERLIELGLKIRHGHNSTSFYYRQYSHPFCLASFACSAQEKIHPNHRSVPIYSFGHSFFYLYFLVQDGAWLTDFSSLEGVLILFHQATPEAAAAGWMHYLAF